MSNKRKVLSVIEKVAIIKDSESGVKNNAICKKYGLSSSTVSTLLKNKEPLLHAYERNITASKRLKKCDKTDLDEVLYRWYIFQKNSGLPTNCSTMRDQAQIFAYQLGYENFSSTNGWLHRFRMRHNIFPFKKSSETVLESAFESSICSESVQLDNFEIVKNEGSDSETSLLSNSTRSKENTINTSALYVNNSQTNGRKSVETFEEKEIGNTLFVPAVSISENNLQELDAIDHNDKAVKEINSKTLNNSLSSHTTYKQKKEIANVDCQVEAAMLDVVKHVNETGAANNFVAERTQLLPLHFYSMATHCVETLQCFFESIDQKDKAVLDALEVIRHKLSNVDPNKVSSDKR